MKGTTPKIDEDFGRAADAVAVDEALARLARIELTLLEQQMLTKAERALLPGAMFDHDDVAGLAASVRCVLAGRSSFEEAMGLTGRWRARARAQALRDLLVRIPTKSAGIRSRSREILGRLRRYRESAVGFAADVRSGRQPKGERLALLAALDANEGEVPGFSTIRRAIAGSAHPPFVEPATGVNC
jgi:hypothetical protein